MGLNIGGAGTHCVKITILESVSIKEVEHYCSLRLSTMISRMLLNSWGCLQGSIFKIRGINPLNLVTHLLQWLSITCAFMELRDD